MKIHNFENIDKSVRLVMEESSALRRAKVISYCANQPRISIGAHSYIQNGEIIAVESIGRFCSIGRFVTIGQDPRNHPVDWVSSSMRLCEKYSSPASGVKIGNDVWIGEGAVIMAGLEIGDGAIIAMNAVVTKNVEPYQIVGGNPAKVIKFRFESSVRDALIASRWWNKELDILKTLDCSNVGEFINKVSAIEETASYRSILIDNRKVTLC